MADPYCGNIVAEGRRGTHLLYIIWVDPARVYTCNNYYYY